MSLKKIVAGCLAVALTSSSVFCGIFDYFEALADSSNDTLSLSIEESIRHESNIYGSASHKTSGYVLSSGLNADWRKNDSIVNYRVSGKVGYDWDFRHSDKNETWYSIAPSAFIKHGSWDLLISAGSKYSKDAVSVRDRRLARSFDNNAGADWNLNIGELWGIGVNFTWKDKEYTGSEFKNRNYDSYALSVSPYYNLTAKTKVGLRGGVEYKKYHRDDLSDDSRTLFADVFADYRATGKLSLSAFAGLDRKHYYRSNDYEYAGSEYGKGKMQAHYGIAANYKACSNLILTAKLSKEQEDNDVAGSRSSENDTEASLSAAWQINTKLSLEQKVSYKWVDEKDNGYDSTELNYSADVVYALMAKRMEVFGGFEYEKVKFDDADNMDYDNTIVRLGGRYRF